VKHFPQTVFSEEKHGEEPADQKKKRHAEFMNHNIDKKKPAILPVVLNRPRAGKKAEGGVQDDAQYHGHAPERIQISPAFKRWGTDLDHKYLAGDSNDEVRFRGALSASGFGICFSCGRVRVI
jgi:hypothetical protein